MSERGIEIHNGYAVLPELTRGISIGTRDSPVTQQDATMQAVIGVFLDTSALGIGWDIHGVWAWINAAVDRDGDIVGVEARCYIEADITVGGKVYGMHTRIYAASGAVVTSDFDGIHIYMNADPASTLSSNVRVISILNAIRKQPAGSYYVLDFEDSGGLVVQSIINTNVGVSGDVTYFLRTVQATSAWGSSGTPGTGAGWIAVRIAGEPRWIQLYSVAP